MMNSPKLTAAFSKLILTPPNSPSLLRRSLSSGRSKSVDLVASTSQPTRTTPQSSPRLNASKRKFCSATTSHHLETPENKESNEASALDLEPAVSQATVSPSQWTWQGSKRQFIQKNSEQFWLDLHDNRQELAWSRLEKVHKTVHPTPEEAKSVKWYDDWKVNAPVHKPVNQHHIVSLDMEQIAARAELTYSPEQVRLATNTSPLSRSADLPSVILSLPDQSDHRAFMDSVGRKLGVQTMEDWYKFNILDVSSLNCREILAQHGNSLIQTLMSVYPEYNWKIWKFQNSYKGGILNDEHEVQPIKVALESQNAASEDFNTSFDRYKDHWQVKLFSPSNGNSWAHQSAKYIRPNDLKKDNLDAFHLDENAEVLQSTVQKIFSGKKVETNYSNPDLVYSDTKRPFTLSAYVPDARIAFEFVEDPNYSWQYAFGANFSIHTFHKAKRAVCDKLGITLIEVPSWWNREQAALEAAIKKMKPQALIQ